MRVLDFTRSSDRVESILNYQQTSPRGPNDSHYAYEEIESIIKSVAQEIKPESSFQPKLNALEALRSI